MPPGSPDLESRLRAWGYAGTLPFMALALLAWVPAPADARWMPAAFAAWSAVILAFLAGSWWGRALAADPQVEPRVRPALATGAVLLSALAAVGAWWPGAPGIGILLAGHLLFRWLERLPSHRGLSAPWYERLRSRLTWIVAVCHVLMLTWTLTGFHD